MKPNKLFYSVVLSAVIMAFPNFGFAEPKPNILFIVSDDTGYGDLGPYGGGEGRGMPTPSLDRMAAEGMTFFSFYASRAARQAVRRCRPDAYRTAAA